MDNYDDIINKSRPEHINDEFSAKHPKMSIDDRAKIFSPFAALRGHSAYVHKRERTTVGKIELSPDDAKVLSDILSVIAEKVRLGEKPDVCVTYFIPDKERRGEGRYADISGNIRKFNTDMGFLKIGDENIFFENIYFIKIR